LGTFRMWKWRPRLIHRSIPLYRSSAARITVAPSKQPSAFSALSAVNSALSGSLARPRGESCADAAKHSMLTGASPVSKQLCRRTSRSSKAPSMC
jgi:hypothetical protein